MVMQRKLDQKQERYVALAFLCGVNTDYIRQNWGVSDATTRASVVRKRSREWNDPLVEFYRQTDGRNRGRNAIHMYLTFNQQAEGLPNVDLIDLKREKPVYEAVDGSIFSLRTENLIRETNLERLLEKSDLSREEKLIRAIFGEKIDGYQQALELVNPLIYQRLKEAYQEAGKAKPFQNQNQLIDKVYGQLAESILEQLRYGLTLAQNPQVVEYAKSLEKEGVSELTEQVRELLRTLTPQEERVLKMRFGIGERTDQILDEIGKDFDVTRERIRQIEAKALRKIRHPTRSKMLRTFYQG